VCTPTSSTNTSRLASTSWATITRQAALKNSSRSVAARPLFARGTDPSYGATHGRAAHRNPAYGLYVVATLSEGDERALFEVLFEELPDSLIHLGTFAGCLTWLRGLSPLGLGGVTLDGRDPETPKVRAASALGMPRSMASTIF
jgi:hypothetical protein